MDKISCKLLDWNFEPLDVQNLTNELRIVWFLLHLFGESQTRLANFGYITQFKSKNACGLNEVSLPLARMDNLF